MARLWSCGAELQSTTNGVEWDTTTGTVSISTTTVRSGAASFRCNPTAATGYIQHTYRVDTETPVFYRAYIRFASFPTADCVILGHSDGGFVQHIPGIRFLAATSQLQVWNNVAVVGSPSPALSLNTWYRLELSYDDSTAGDPTSAYLDGVAFASGVNGGDMFGGGVLKIGIITPSTTADMFIDDIAVNDNAGTAQNGLPGEGSIVHLQPNAAGAANAWPVVVGGTGGAGATNYTRVSEVTPDNATSYNQTSATGTTQFDEFNVTDSATAGIGASDTVTLVAVGHRSGSTGVTAASVLYRLRGQSGGTTQQASANVNINGWFTHQINIPRTYLITAYQNPQGPTAWTVAALDTMQIGYGQNVTQSTTRRVSTIWALVEYVPAATATSPVLRRRVTSGLIIR